MDININELPKELKEAIYIEDCHISGMHDPEHTTKYICQHQYANLAKRVLGVVFGVDFDLIEDPETSREQAYKELNKIPRKLDHSGWYDYFRRKGRPQAKELEEWEKDGFKVKNTHESP